MKGNLKKVRIVVWCKVVTRDNILHTTFLFLSIFVNDNNLLKVLVTRMFGRDLRSGTCRFVPGSLNSVIPPYFKVGVSYQSIERKLVPNPE